MEHPKKSSKNRLKKLDTNIHQHRNNHENEVSSSQVSKDAVPPPYLYPTVKKTPPPSLHEPVEQPTEPAVCYTKKQLEQIIEDKKALLQILMQDEETVKNLKGVKDIAVKVTNLTHERQDRSMEVEAHRNEFDANVAGTYQVMHTMYGVCATGSLPRTQFTCEPIVLPKLNPPNSDNLSKYPGGVKLPPIIVNHENFCLNGGKAPETQRGDDNEEMLKEIANLRLACMTFKKSYAANLCEVVDQQPQVQIQEAANDNGANPELTDRFGRQPAPDEETIRKQEQAKKKTENENLMEMLGTLQADIQAIKSSNTKGRRSIIERCIELKQREAAIVECSQMLCHILDAQRTVDDLLIEWQNAKLKRHIEYLRWVLIRLKYERHVQNNEIKKLDSSLRQQKYVLLECLETKRRVCDAEKESSVNQMDVFDICALLD